MNFGELLFIAMRNEEIVSEDWLPGKIRKAFTVKEESEDESDWYLLIKLIQKVGYKYLNSN